MRRLFAALCAAVLCFLLLSRGAAAAEEPEIPAVSYVLMEAETGTILLESEGEKKVSCGTMAKLMTALLTAEQIEQGRWTTDSPITVTDGVTGTKGAVIWLTAGEVMTAGDLLKGLLIGNANDAAVALAAAVSGDTETFVMEMNARAFDLEMRSTRFSSPQGDGGPEQYTTAADLARLCRALTQYPVLKPYLCTWRDFLRGEATELVNENTLTRTDETCIGFKACHTEADGWSIAAGAERNHMQCITVVLGCQEDNDRFALAKQLLRKGFSGWKVLQPGFSGEFLYPIPVRRGVDRAVLAEPGKLRGLAVPKGCGELETVLVLPCFIQAPVRKGQQLGSVAFYQDGTLLYETTVIAADAVRKRNYGDALLEIAVKLLKM